MIERIQRAELEKLLALGPAYSKHLISDGCNHNNNGGSCYRNWR